MHSEAYFQYNWWDNTQTTILNYYRSNDQKDVRSWTSITFAIIIDTNSKFESIRNLGKEHSYVYAANRNILTAESGSIKNLIWKKTSYFTVD